MTESKQPSQRARCEMNAGIGEVKQRAAAQVLLEYAIDVQCRTSDLRERMDNQLTPLMFPDCPVSDETKRCLPDMPPLFRDLWNRLEIIETSVATMNNYLDRVGV